MHVPCHLHLTAVFKVYLELQGTVQVSSTSSVDMMLFVLTQDRTVEDGELFATAFPGLTMYSFQNTTEHRVTVTGVDDVTALDGYVFQRVCTA